MIQTSCHTLLPLLLSFFQPLKNTSQDLRIQVGLGTIVARRRFGQPHLFPEPQLLLDEQLVTTSF